MTAAPNQNYLLAIFLGSTAFVFLNFGLPLRADDLGMSAVDIGGMYAVFTGTMLLFRPLVGFCLDRFGRRWFFTVAFVFYTAAMSVMADSSGMSGFYFARFLQGIGASLMWVSARTMVADLYASEQRGQAMGKLTTTSVRGSMIGAMYGFTLIGFMPMNEAWFWAFAGYAACAAVGFVCSFWTVQETRSPAPKAEGLKVPWTLELRRAMIIVFFSAFATTLIEPIYLLYLRNKFDLNVVYLALAFAPAGLVFAFLPRYSGQWSDRIGRAPVIALGVVFAGLVSISLPFWPSIILVGLAYILFSVGWAMASPAEEALVADMATDSLRGTVIGLKETFAGLGAATGPLIGGYIYENWSQTVAFVVNGVLLLVVALLAMVWFSTGKQSENSGAKQ